MSKTFRIGGIHPPDSKISRGEAVVEPGPPESVTIPVSQHIGAPAEPCVAKGDKVKAGQLIAKAVGFVSANVHSSVSGTVTAVDTVPDGGGVRRTAITIKTEGDEWVASVDRTDKLSTTCTLSPKEIIDRIAACGIVGMGGAAFPTQVKLSVPPGTKAEYLLINAAECEPYLTSDHREMLEHGEEILVGVQILKKALGVEKAFIGIEKNKKDAIKHLSDLAMKHLGIEIVPLKTKYPQGGEKQLIEAVIGRQVSSCALPISVGAVVQNLSTALAVYYAVQKNRPLVERVVTVTGKGLEKPSNLRVRIGTPISALIEKCGGLPGSTGKVINGGPMMGRAVANLDSVVTKGTSGILLMDSEEASRREPSPCIKCGKCITVCPMGLEPYLLYKLGRRRMFAETEGHGSMDCIECGSCAYGCPAALPLLDIIRLGKTEALQSIRSRNAAK